MGHRIPSRMGQRTSRNPSKALFEELFAKAGIEVNGSRSWDIRVANPRTYARVLAQGSLGLGESYMEGWWNCDALDQFFTRVIGADLGSQVRANYSLLIRLAFNKFRNLQFGKRLWEVGRKHYDLGNDLFAAMLDKRMVYTCAFWQDAETLDQAQEAKLKLICEKLQLSPGMRILDLGCGWGGFAKYAAETYGVEVVGVTISKEQVKLASEICRSLPITIELKDYRQVQGKFDRVAGIGILEHVGYKNYRRFMEVVFEHLKEDGLCLLHSICNNKMELSGDPWVVKYIFPNSVSPSLNQLAKASEGLFVIESLQNIGPDYDPTLMAWNENFQKAWSRLEATYDERFRRMWTYYLLMAAGNFRAGSSQVSQILMRPRKVS